MTPHANLREMWDFDDPAASEERFRDLRAASTGEFALEVATQIARALGLQGRFDEAEELLSSIEPSQAGPRVRTRWLLERGRVLNSSGRPELAAPLFAEAWDESRSASLDALAVDAAHMVAIVAPASEKRSWNEAAMRVAESSDDPEARRWLGSLYNNMGWDAHEAGDYEDALRLHERCLAWHRERHTGSGERIATWSVAKQLRFLGRREEALSMQRGLLAEYHREDPGGEGFVHEEIAELLLEDGDEEGAGRHFARAHELLSGLDWVEPGRLDRMRRLAR